MYSIKLVGKIIFKEGASMPYVRKVKKINNVIVFVYGLLLLISCFHVNSYWKVIIPYVIITTGILLFLNYRLHQDHFGFRSLYHHYTFYIFVLHSILLTNKHESLLFPTIFILPVLFVSVNFTRRESTGIAILSFVTIGIILLADPLKIKMIEVIVTSLFILVLPQIVGYLIKMHLNHVRKLMKISRQFPVD